MREYTSRIVEPKDIKNNDLVELLIDIVEENHYSPRKSIIYAYSDDEIREEIIRRMSSDGEN